MPAKLDNFVIDTLKPGSEISVTDLTNRIKSHFPTLKENTLQVYISRLKKSGLIANPSRGTYSSEAKPTFTPNFSEENKSLYNQIKREYPFIDICIWDTSFLNDFMVHQAFRSFKIVEVEKDAVNQVFQFLSQNNQNTYLNPKSEVFDNYINPNPNQITIVKTLKSEGPLITSSNIIVPAIEKILVDIVADAEIFSAQQDELDHIYKSAFQKYAINKQNLKRYASRRNRKEEIEKRVYKALAII